MDDLPNALVLHILALLPLDARLRCASVSQRFAALVADAAQWRALSFKGVPRARRAAVDDAALAALVARAGRALRRLDLSVLPRDAAVSPAGVLAALRSAPAVREVCAWHAHAPEHAQAAVANELVTVALDHHALATAPLVALLRGHADSRTAQLFFANALSLAALPRSASRNTAAQRAALAAREAGALDALLEALALHAEDFSVVRECMHALCSLTRFTAEERLCARTAARATAAALAALHRFTPDADTCTTALRALQRFAGLRRGGTPGVDAAAVVAVLCATLHVAHTYEPANAIEVRRVCLTLVTNARGVPAAYGHDAMAAVLLQMEGALGRDAEDTAIAVLAVAELLMAAPRRGSGPRVAPAHAARLLAAALATLAAAATAGSGSVLWRNAVDGALRLVFVLHTEQERPPGTQGCSVLEARAIVDVSALLSSLYSGADLDVEAEAANAGVCLSALSALHGLLRCAGCGGDNPASHRAAAAVAGAHAAVARAAAALPADTGVQFFVCTCFGALASAWPCERDILCAGGSIDLVTAALRRFSAVPGQHARAVRDAALATLRMLTLRGDAACARVMDAGGPEAALAALRRRDDGGAALAASAAHTTDALLRLSWARVTTVLLVVPRQLREASRGDVTAAAAAAVDAMEAVGVDALAGLLNPRAAAAALVLCLAAAEGVGADDKEAAQLWSSACGTLHSWHGTCSMLLRAASTPPAA